ncbi:MAG: alkaline phosphatase family protein [Myxococcota bacterium]
MQLPRPTFPLIIIGLDGATFDILDLLFSRGELPTLRRLAEGMRTELHSTIPPATLPAWTSFLTAANPGRHGVVDIFVRPPREYGLLPASGSLRTEATFLRHLSDAGLQVAALGVPGTHPPEPINGVCIAGFDAPGVNRAAPSAYWPKELYRDVEHLGGWHYATFNEHQSGMGQIDHAIAALEEDIARKEHIALTLFKRRPWDVFFLHLQASDTVGHHFWQTFDPNSPRRPSDYAGFDAVSRIYQRLDALIGRLLQSAPKNHRVLVVSDHGMGGASNTAVYLNRWLEQHGWLKFVQSPKRWARRAVGKSVHHVLKNLPPSLLGAATRHVPTPLAKSTLSLMRGVSVDYRRTLAYSDELDYAPSIWLNRRGVFPDGILSDSEAETLATNIRQQLLQLVDPDTQESLVKAVYRRDEVMPGAHLERAPDLIVEPAWPKGYRPSFLPSTGPGTVVGHLDPKALGAAKGHGMPGVHRREGVFIASGPDIAHMELPVMHIGEAGATVYALLGLAPPAGLEYAVPEFVATHLKVQHNPEIYKLYRETSQTDLAQPQTLAIVQRLRALGYVD